MNIYCYFDANAAKPGDGEMIRLWKTSWERQGWTPKILTPLSAKPHRRYAEFVEHIKGRPPYVQAGLMRWLALDVVRGGWLSEFDLMNFSFKPVTPRESVRTYHGLTWLKPRAARKVSLEWMTGVPSCLLSSLRLDSVVYDHLGWETAPLVWFFGKPWAAVANCPRKF